LSTFFFISG